MPKARISSHLPLPQFEIYQWCPIAISIKSKFSTMLFYNSSQGLSPGLMCPSWNKC